MDIKSSQYKSENFVFDFKFENNDESMKSLACSDGFNLPPPHDQDNKMALFVNMYGNFCLLHQKPINDDVELRLQLICGNDVKNIDITTRNEVFHSQKLEYKMFSGNDNVFGEGDIPDEWKDENGFYHLKLIFSIKIEQSN